jgi:hypothetical protein
VRKGVSAKEYDSKTPRIARPVSCLSRLRERLLLRGDMEKGLAGMARKKSRVKKKKIVLVKVLVFHRTDTHV